MTMATKDKLAHNAKLDELVFTAIKTLHGKAKEIETLVSRHIVLDRPSFRDVDRSLQRLRKQGKIFFASPRLGWRIK